MPFDIAGARKAGYSDEEIAKEIQVGGEYRAHDALKSGYSLDDIAKEMDAGPAKMPEAPPELVQAAKNGAAVFDATMAPYRLDWSDVNKDERDARTASDAAVFVAQGSLAPYAADWRDALTPAQKDEQRSSAVLERDALVKSPGYAERRATYDLGEFGSPLSEAEQAGMKRKDFLDAHIAALTPARKPSQAELYAADKAETQKALREAGLGPPDVIETLANQVGGGILHQLSTVARSFSPSSSTAGNLADWLQSAGDQAEFYAGINNDTKSGIARGVADVASMVSANPAGKVGMVVGALRGAMQTHAEVLSATGDAGKADSAAAHTFPALLAYLGVGKVAAGVGAQIAGKAASPLTQGIAGGAVSAAGNVATSAGLRVMSGGEALPDTEGLTADLLFAGVHAADVVNGAKNLHSLVDGSHPDVAKLDMMARDPNVGATMQRKAWAAKNDLQAAARNEMGLRERKPVDDQGTDFAKEDAAKAKEDAALNFADRIVPSDEKNQEFIVKIQSAAPAVGPETQKAVEALATEPAPTTEESSAVQPAPTKPATDRVTRNRVFEGGSPIGTQDQTAFRATDLDSVYRATGAPQIEDIVASGEVRSKDGKIKGGRSNETHWSAGDASLHYTNSSYVIEASKTGMHDRQGGIPIKELKAIWTKRGEAWVDILPEISRERADTKVTPIEPREQSPTAEAVSPAPSAEPKKQPTLLEYAKSRLPAATAEKITDEKQVESFRKQWEREYPTQRDIFAGTAQDPLNLSGGLTMDGERVTREKAAAEKASAEAKVIQDSQQGDLLAESDTDYRMGHRPNEEGPRLFDLLENDLAPRDIYTHPHYTFDLSGDAAKESLKAIQGARGKPDKLVTIYRAAPDGAAFNHGDWVTLSKKYAEQHGITGDGASIDMPVISLKVPAKDLKWAGDDPNEFGYFPEQNPVGNEPAKTPEPTEANGGNERDASKPEQMTPEAGNQPDLALKGGSAPAAPRKRASLSSRMPESGGWDIIDAIQGEVGSLRGSTYYHRRGERPPPEYDGAGQLPAFWRSHLMSKEGGRTPDQAAQALYDAGMLRSPDVNLFWEEIAKAVKTRNRVRAESKEQEKQMKGFEAQSKRFNKDALADVELVPGEDLIFSDHLDVGDVVTVGKEDMRVKGRDADGKVMLEGGKKYGEQEVEPGVILRAKLKDRGESQNTAPGASHVTELQKKQVLTGAEIYHGLKEAAGAAPERETWERNFLREYPELEGVTYSPGAIRDVDRAWQLSKVASDEFARVKDGGGVNPSMDAIVENLYGRETGPSESRSGIKNAASDEAMRKAGLPAQEKPPVRTNIFAREEAGHFMRDNPQAMDELLGRLRQDPMASVNEREVIMLGLRGAELDTAWNFTQRELFRAIEANDKDGERSAMDRLSQMRPEYQDFHRIAKTAGTEAARAFHARGLMFTGEFHVETMKARRSAEKGEELTPEETLKVEASAARINELEEQLAARTTKEGQDDAESLKAAQATLAEAAKYSPVLLEHARKLLDGWKKKVTASESRFRELAAKMLGKTSVNPFHTEAIEMVKMLTERALVHISEKGLNAADFAAEMVRQAGEGIQNLIKPAWDMALKMIGKDPAAPKEKTDRVKKKEAKANGEAASTEDGIKGVIEGEGFKDQEHEAMLKQLAPMVKRLAKEYVQGGTKTLEELENRLHAFFEPLLPEVTKRQLRDAFSGYGESKPAPTDALKVLESQLRQEALLTTQIEAIEKREPLLATGVRRVEPSDRARRLIEQRNDLRKKMGIVTGDPAKLLKSALDSMEKRAQNRINDLRFEIAKGDRIVREKADKPTSEKLEKLRAELAQVEVEHAAVFGKREMSPEQRLKAAITSAERAEVAANAELANAKKGVFTKPVKAGVSPALEVVAIRKRAEAAKAETEALRSIAYAGENEHADAQDALNRALVDREKINQLLQDALSPSKPRSNIAPLELEADVRAEISAMRDLAAEIKRDARPKPDAQKQKEASMVKALEKAAAEYERRLNAFDFSARPKTAGKDTARVAAARALKDAAKAAYEAGKNAAKIKPDPAKVAVDIRKSQLTRSLADYADRRARGEYGPKPKKAPTDISQDPEAVNLALKLDKEKAEWQKEGEAYRVKKLNWMEKLGRNLGLTWDATRHILLSMDLSATIQTGAAGFMHPIYFSKAIAKGLDVFVRSFASGYAAKAAEMRIVNSADYKSGLYRDMKLAIKTDGARDENKYSVLENLAEMQTRWGGVPDVVKGLMGFDVKRVGRGVGGAVKLPFKALGLSVKASNLAFQTIANEMRAVVGSELARKYLTNNLNTSKKGLMMLGDAVNAFTGSGGLRPGGLKILFAPNWYLARIKMITGQPLWNAVYRKEGRVAGIILGQYVRMFAAIAALKAARHVLFGDTDDKNKFGNSFDPEELLDPNAGSIRLPSGFTVDLTQGIGTWASLVARLAAGETQKRDGTIVEQQRMQIFLNFLRGRLTREIRLADMLASGKDYSGKEIGPMEMAWNTVAPLNWQDVGKITKEYGMTVGGFLEAFNFVFPSVKPPPPEKGQ